MLTWRQSHKINLFFLSSYESRFLSWRFFRFIWLSCNAFFWLVRNGNEGIGSDRNDENCSGEGSFASGPLAGHGGAVPCFFLLKVIDPPRRRIATGLSFFEHMSHTAYPDFLPFWCVFPFIQGLKKKRDRSERTFCARDTLFLGAGERLPESNAECLEHRLAHVVVVLPGKSDMGCNAGTVAEGIEEMLEDI